MQPHLPLWIQRLPPEVRRRMELAEAAAREERSDTHAAQALELVSILVPRMPFDEAVARYVDMMDLPGEEAELVRTRALVAIGEGDVEQNLAHERHRTGLGINWRYATPLGAVRFVRRQMRRSAEEDLWMELSAARAEEALIRTHVKHALRFVAILDEIAAPPRVVALYLDQLEVPSARARAVYQRTLAEVARTHLPRLRAFDPTHQLRPRRSEGERLRQEQEPGDE